MMAGKADKRPIERSPAAPAGEVEEAVKWALFEADRYERHAKTLPNNVGNVRSDAEHEADMLRTLAAAATRAAQERRLAAAPTYSPADMAAAFRAGLATGAMQESIDFGPLARALVKLIPDIANQIQRARNRLEPHQIAALREFENFLRKDER